MSDEGDKTCPLCAEEMDLTDQQLKPCKCGYEICVWCWHHIMEMAEKDESEGRCPACRAPYDKEKIVGMASKCESKLVAEIHMERKVKSQKAKAKSSDGRKQLSSVRVIQRNLVYIMGLPPNLADEELLQRREYFSQYGKVLKVSMSRTAAGVIQQYANNTCSVYITYAREDEAVRCIQNVHGFVLEGRSLRACFGTTKYCHAWLRNVPCTNPDCLYLHEVGSQDDSFTKDEIISAYTRVQQITGAANCVQRRSGNVLPPPFDDYCTKSSASSEKPIPKNGTATIGSISRGSPPNGTAGRSIALPAAASWGTRGSNCQPLSANITCTNGPSKQKLDSVSNTSTAGINHSSILLGKKHSFVEESRDISSKEKQETFRPVKQLNGLDCQNSVPEKANAVDKALCPAILKDDNRGTDTPADISDNSVDNDGRSSSSSGQENELMFASEDGNLNLCSEMSSMWNDYRNTMDKNSDEQSREPPITAQQAEASSNGVSDWLSGSKMHVIPSTSSELEEDIISFDNQRLKDPEVMSRPPYMSHSTNSLHSPKHGGYSNAINLNAVNNHRDSLFGCSSSTSLSSNGFHNNMASGYNRISDHSLLPPNGDNMSMHSRRFVGETNDAEINSIVDRGESSIISNILSLDFDTWDQSLRSPQNLAKLLGDDEKQSGSHKMQSSWKPQPNNQSRFSFARQEESVNQDTSRSFFGQLSSTRPYGHEFPDHRDSYFDNKHVYGNGFASGSLEESENYATNHLPFQPNKPTAVSRAPISAPPGFSVPSRAPPPGFASHDRVDHSFDSLSGSRLLDNSSMLRNAYQQQQQHLSANMSSHTDIEFIDPAILAVGKGMLQGNNNGDMRSNYQSQLSPFENDARLHLLQRSLSSQQNVRFPDMGDSFSYNNLSSSSRLVDQPQTGSLNNLSQFAQMSLQQSRNGMISNGPVSNGHWDGWSEAQGGNNLLRNERVGFNKYYTGYDDSKFRMPSSDMYNRTFGM